MPKIDVNGLNMYYELIGEGDPIVLVSGLGADHSGWFMSQVPAFAEAGYQCLVFDNRDAGQTDESPVESYDTRQMAADTAGLMEHLNIDRAHILGASMGGQIAQHLAINHPERVRSLTLACTIATVADEAKSKFLIQTLTAHRVRLTWPEMFELYMPWLFTHRFFDNEEAVETTLQMVQENPYPQSAEGWSRQAAAALAHDTTAWLGRIVAPTHVIVGDEDTLLPPCHSRFLADNIAGATLTEVPEAGHVIWGEKPEEFSQAVLEFLSEH